MRLLDRALRADTTAVGPFREALRQASERLAERFKRDDPIETLVRARAEIVDQIILRELALALRRASSRSLRTSWRSAATAAASCIRSPTSTLLVLLEGKTERNADAAIGRFLTFLWDIGLEPGHSVRTLDDCAAQARSDVTVLTTLMETRLLHGPGRLFAQLRRGSALIAYGTARSSSRRR